METALNAVTGPKPKPHAKVTQHKPKAKAKPTPQAQDRHLAESGGYDDSVFWKIELTGLTFSVDGGSRHISLPTARKNLVVHLRWKRSKLTNSVTKADVYLEQEGIGYDTITYLGENKLDSEHGKSVNWFQHTIVFDIHFTTTAVPIPLNLGQSFKLEGLDKISSSYSGVINGWFDIVTEVNHINVVFI